MSLAGTYKLEKNENLVAILTAGGIPEEHAKKADAEKPSLTIKVDGKKIICKYEGLKNYETTLVDGETVEEPMPTGENALSTTKIEGNVVKVISKNKDGSNSMERVYTTSPKGLVVEITLANGTKGKRFYLRV